MFTESPRVRPPASSEDGIALVTALLGIIVLSGLAVVFVATAMTQSRATGDARDLETAIHVAEAAIDELLPCVVVETIPPPPPMCNDLTDADTGATVSDGEIHQLPADPSGVLPPDAFESGSHERVWVLEEAEEAEHVLAAGPGEGVAIRPLDRDGNPMDVVYAVGWIPNRDSPVRTRVVKIRFDNISGAGPGLLVGGDLAFSGAGSIEGTNGSVHANGGITSGGGGGGATCSDGIYVEHDFTTSGAHCPGWDDDLGDPCGKPTVEGKCLAGEPMIPVPTITAESMYASPHLATKPWWDLCPGGIVRPHGGAGGPCSSSTIEWQGAPDETQRFRGWRFQHGVWRGQSVDEGVYYVYEANARLQSTIDQGTQPPEIAIIVDKGSVTSGELAGNIEFAGNARLQAPGMHGLALLADRDIDFTTSAGFVRGLVTSGEQIKLRAPTIEGAVIAQDAPHTPGSPVDVSSVLGSANIIANKDFEAFGRRPRITHWNEL